MIYDLLDQFNVYFKKGFFIAKFSLTNSFEKRVVQRSKVPFELKFYKRFKKNLKFSFLINVLSKIFDQVIHDL